MTGRFVAEKTQCFVEIAGKKIPAVSTTSFFLAPPPPIEALTKRERDRLLGYLQIREENAAGEQDTFVYLGTTFEMEGALQVAANAYGASEVPFRTPGTFVDAMIRELANLSGHSDNTVAGALTTWGKGKSPADWKAIWTGQPTEEPTGDP